MNDINDNQSNECNIGSEDFARVERWEKNAGIGRGKGAPEGNTNALKHGIYADRFLSADEKKLFDSIIMQLNEDFVFNKSSDFMQVELVAVYYLKLGRAQQEGDWDAAERLDRMIRCHLKDLKTTKITREGTEPTGDETTPAEWATALLERLAEAEKSAKNKLESEKTPE